MDITESGFQTPASKKRKASLSPSLPPASQPTMPPSNYKNKIPIIATGIDPKFTTPIKIMSELRQYHPNLRVLQIKQTKMAGFSTEILPKTLPSRKAILERNMDCLQQATSLICIKLVKSLVLGLTHNYWQTLEGIGTMNTKNAEFNRISDI